MVGALHWGLVVRTHTTMLSGKLSAVGQHVHLGFHYVLVPMPHVANEDYQPREVGNLTSAQPLRGQKEWKEAKEHFQEDMKVRFHLLIDHTFNKK